ISQAKGISEKKQETCLKNYGTNWFLERQDLKDEFVFNKYGVKHIQQVQEVKQKRIDTVTGDFYDELLKSNRFDGKVKVAFSKNEYAGTCKEYKFQCTVCNSFFNYDLRWGRIPRCPTCYKNSSIFEKEITEYIKSILPPTEIILENTKSTLSNNYELDIYIPFKKIAIECNGLFWHGEVGGNKSKKYHLNKTLECENLGIRLIHILEDEWLLRKDIVKNKLSNIFGVKKSDTIYARNCDIKEISSTEKNVFLN